jgi:hypothetical protein
MVLARGCADYGNGGGMKLVMLVLVWLVLGGCGPQHDERWYRNDETIKLNNRAVQYLLSEQFKAMEPAQRQGAILAIKAVVLDPQYKVQP